MTNNNIFVGKGILWSRSFCSQCLLISMFPCCLFELNNKNVYLFCLFSELFWVCTTWFYDFYLTCLETNFVLILNFTINDILSKLFLFISRKIRSKQHVWIIHNSQLCQLNWDGGSSYLFNIILCNYLNVFVLAILNLCSGCGRQIWKSKN
jgi:hypothetical protein